MPLICCSSGAATVSAIVFGLAPGYVARTTTVGGTISGYSLTGNRNSDIAPTIKMITDQGQKFVLTLSSTNTAEYRQVKLGPAIDGKRIVRSGLNAGDQIVVNGLQRVRPGMPVTPQSAMASNDGVVKTARR